MYGKFKILRRGYDTRDINKRDNWSTKVFEAGEERTHTEMSWGIRGRVCSNRPRQRLISMSPGIDGPVQGAFWVTKVKGGGMPPGDLKYPEQPHDQDKRQNDHWHCAKYNPESERRKKLVSSHVNPLSSGSPDMLMIRAS